MEDPKCPRCGSNEVKKVKTKLRLSYPLVALVILIGAIVTGITESPWGLVGAAVLIALLSILQGVRNKKIAYIFCKICGNKWGGAPENAEPKSRSAGEPENDAGN